MKKLIYFLLVLLSVSVHAQRDPYPSMTERNGKIGIGTSNPDQLLTVKGKIHTREVLVDLNGAVAPDYVFEHYFTRKSDLKQTYRMMSLPELEQYIEKYHHLPGIASAQEMVQEGVALKELALKLLEKIEELSLYTIEQQKQIEQLKEELNSLKND